VKTGILGAAFMKGQMAAGVIPTAKHYPGHGDTGLDSHGVLPKIDVPFERLWDRELVPYRMLAREGIPAVMSGHLAFPRTPAASAPASLSPWFLKEVLRDMIGYGGIVITDDLLMNGATAYAGSVSGAARQALMAGNDIIMLSRTPALDDPVWKNLAAAMKEDAEFRTRVRDAACRILKVKLRHLRGEKVPYVPNLAKLDTELPSPEGAAFFADLAARSVTVLRNNGAFPLSPAAAGRVLLAGSYGDFFSLGKAAYPQARFVRHSAGAAGLLSSARDADTVIFCLSGPEDLPLLRSLEPLKKRVIVLSVLSPVHIEGAPWADGALAVYSYARESFAAGFSAILGRIPAEGKLPYR
jgi:beta-N-acetylhexosaminidase